MPVFQLFYSVLPAEAFARTGIVPKRRAADSGKRVMAKQRQNYMYRKEYAGMLADKLDVDEEDADAILLAFLDVLKETWSRDAPSASKTSAYLSFGRSAGKWGATPGLWRITSFRKASSRRFVRQRN